MWHGKSLARTRAHLAGQVLVSLPRSEPVAGATGAINSRTHVRAASLGVKVGSLRHALQRLWARFLSMPWPRHLLTPCQGCCVDQAAAGFKRCVGREGHRYSIRTVNDHRSILSVYVTWLVVDLVVHGPQNPQRRVRLQTFTQVISGR